MVLTFSVYDMCSLLISLSAQIDYKLWGLVLTACGILTTVIIKIVMVKRKAKEDSKKELKRQFAEKANQIDLTALQQKAKELEDKTGKIITREELTQLEQRAKTYADNGDKIILSLIKQIQEANNNAHTLIQKSVDSRLETIGGQVKQIYDHLLN